MTVHEIEGVVLSIDWLHNKQTINTLAASADTEIEYWIKGSKWFQVYTQQDELLGILFQHLVISTTF